MSQKGSCNEFLTVADLKCALLSIEQDLPSSNKPLLAKLLKGFCRLTEFLSQKKPGIFSVVVTWFRLYLKMQTSIDPNNNKLLQQYEKTIPTAISYIIGCLQYNSKDVSNFHYNLLEIIDALLQNSKPNVVKQCANFTNGTVACIWKPITFAGDFNTQTLALKIFARLLKSLDTGKQEGELKTIKWSNLNLFKDKLNKVIEGTNQIYVYENACRELLNNFNMELTKNVLIYSLYCKSLVIGNSFEFFKPLITNKFWVDINYRPKTISFKGRHKFEMNLNFEDVDVNLKWSNINLGNGCLVITIDKTVESKLPVTIFSKLKKRDKMKIYLTEKEEQRLKDNEHMMKNLMEIESNIQYYNDESPQTNHSETVNNLPETPLTSRSNTTDKSKHYLLRQQTPKRKFFSYMEEKCTKLQKQTKKKTSIKKPRILKPRCDRKSVCKVVPVVVDLTRTPELKTSEIIHPQPLGRITTIGKHLFDGNECCISDKQCLTILNKVSNSTKKEETYKYHYESDAEPCQSYRCFKTRSVSSCSDRPNSAVCKTDRAKNTDTEKPNEGQIEIIEESSVVCPTKQQHGRNKVTNENNNVPNSMQRSKLQNSNKRKLLSQNIFDQIKDDDNTPTRHGKILKETPVSNKETVVTLLSQNIFDQINDDDRTTTRHSELLSKASIPNKKTDITLDYNNKNENEGESIECDVLRFSNNIVMCSTPMFSPHSYPKTPTSTKTMNISDINNTPNVVNTSDHFLLKEPRTENEIADHFLFGADNQMTENILIDCQTYQKDTNAKFSKGNGMVVQIIDTPEYKYKKNDQSSSLEDCVIYRKRLDSDDSDSEIGDFSLHCTDLKSTTFAKPINKQPEFPAAPQLNPTSPNKEILLKELGKNDIITTTNYQVTPFGCVEQCTQIHTKETVIYNTHVKSALTNKDIHTKQHTVLSVQSLNSILPNCDMSNNENDKNRRNFIGHSVIGFQTSNNKMVVQCPETSSGSTLQHKANTRQATKALGNSNNECLKNKLDSRQFIQLSENKGTCTNSEDLPGKQWLSGVFECIEHKDNSEDRRSYAAYCPMSQKDELFKKDLSKLKEQYYMKLRNMLNNLRPQCVASSFDETKDKMCEITENIVSQSKEHRKELELLQLEMGRLMRQMEWQYEIYQNKTKQFESFHENAERILNAFGCLSLQTGVSNEYQDVIDQFNVAEANICKAIWQNFFELHKQNLLQNINSLSDI